jgi:DNA-binding GntR family transcriptional regulator
MPRQIESLSQFVFHEFGPPRHEQLAVFFERAIRTGEFSSGDRLPTVRQLSSLMKVSATTISSAVDLLRSRKFVRAEVGRGTFVVSDWQGSNGTASNAGRGTEQTSNQKRFSYEQPERSIYGTEVRER